MLPSTALDGYAATLARWFGVSPTEMRSGLASNGSFTNPNLDFMR